MQPVTHLLATWVLADTPGRDDLKQSSRDCALITWCGVLPDLDGVGLLIDLAKNTLGGGDAVLYYASYHRLLLHGLAGAILLPGIMMLFGQRKKNVFIWGFLAVHLHLLCDILGSRGPALEDIWPIHYLAPFSMHWTITWLGQWPLMGGINAFITLALIAVIVWMAVKRGYSIVAAFSPRWDQALMRLPVWHHNRNP